MLRRLPDNTVYDKFASPVGDLTLIASSKHLIALLWESDWKSSEVSKIISTLPRKPNHKIIKDCKSQLKEYFSGKRRKFNLPIKLDGTDFQVSAWKSLKKIPYGKTISYKEQAIALGDEKKVRAVGSANGRNPISIIVPCHRVIAKTGDLQGFGGGLEAKSFLIGLEQSNM